VPCSACSRRHESSFASVAGDLKALVAHVGIPKMRVHGAIPPEVPPTDQPRGMMLRVAARREADVQIPGLGHEGRDGREQRRILTLFWSGCAGGLLPQLLFFSLVLLPEFEASEDPAIGYLAIPLVLLASTLGVAGTLLLLIGEETSPLSVGLITASVGGFVLVVLALGSIDPT
jgi:hypothetical protein